MSHFNLQSAVATTSFDQIDRMVLNAVSPNFASTTSGQFGSITITGPANGSVVSTDELFIWNPTASGASNLITTRLPEAATDAFLKDCSLLSLSAAADFKSLPTWTTLPAHATAKHDPDVRALYPGLPVRPTHAKCVMDVNMGGGHARLRAVPLTKDMMTKPLWELRDSIMSDVHTVHKMNISGTETRRFTYKPWVQSRRALGDFSIRGTPTVYDTEINNIAVDNRGGQVGGANSNRWGGGIGYSDEFPYGGWLFCFEHISMAAMGATPLVTLTSSVTIQVQLGLENNHMAHLGPHAGLKSWMDQHIGALALPAKPAQATATADASKEARPGKEAQGKKPKEKKAFLAPRNTPQGKAGTEAANRIKAAAIEAAKRAAKAIANRAANANYAAGLAAALTNRARNGNVPYAIENPQAALRGRRLKQSGKGKGKGRL
jgi:hypothetical protein